MVQNWNSGDPLPKYSDVEIDPRKFINYSLNPNNPANQGKWLAFVDLGYDVYNIAGRQLAAQDIISQLRQGLPNAPAIQTTQSPYGFRFHVRVEIQGLNGQKGSLITGWQIDNGKEIPRLITNWLEVYT